MNVKKIIWSSLAFIVLAGVFDMLCFWLVDEYTTSFWISVAFLNGSILVLALSSLLMAKKGKYIYLSFQDGFIIGSYTGICVILNLCFALCRMNNVQANVIVNVIILAIYLIFLFIVFANTAAITAQLEHDRKERNAYYDLKDKAERLLGKGNGIQLNKRIESMYDKICSCQINRTVDVSATDARILSELTDLEIVLEEGEGYGVSDSYRAEDKTAELDGSDTNGNDVVEKKIAKVMALIDERNKQIVNTLKR